MHITRCIWRTHSWEGLYAEYMKDSQKSNNKRVNFSTGKQTKCSNRHFMEEDARILSLVSSLALSAISTKQIKSAVRCHSTLNGAGEKKSREQQPQTLPSFQGVEPLDTQFIAHGDIRRQSSICSARYSARFSDAECVLPFAPVIPFLGLSCSEIKTTAATCSELLIPVGALFLFFRGLTIAHSECVQDWGPPCNAAAQ